MSMLSRFLRGLGLGKALPIGEAAVRLVALKLAIRNVYPGKASATVEAAARAAHNILQKGE